MVSQQALFDFEPEPTDQDDELRADDSAATSCRYCSVLTTAAGIDSREHGPGAAVCAMYLERYRDIRLVSC